MIVVVRNASGFGLFLAIRADGKAIRFRVFTEPPADAKHVHALRPGEPFAMGECPEGIGVRVDVGKAGLSLRVAKRREIIEHLDEFNEPDGDETYLEFIILLLN